MEDRFTEARLHRLRDLDNTNTSPEDALELAGQHLREEGSSGLLLVLIEREEGGVVIYSAGTKLTDSIFMLESAKFILFSGINSGG